MNTKGKVTVRPAVDHVHHTLMDRQKMISTPITLVYRNSKVNERQRPPTVTALLLNHWCQSSELVTHEEVTLPTVNQLPKDVGIMCKALHKASDGISPSLSEDQDVISIREVRNRGGLSRAPVHHILITKNKSKHRDR